MTVPATFGERLAQARRELAVRERRDVLASDIAAAVGVTSATYSRWESGQITPRPDMVTALARVLGVSAGYLLFGEATAPDFPVESEDAYLPVDLSPAEEPRRKRRGGGSA